MRAVDTNVIVRLIARDDPVAERRARTLLDEPFLILPTVILEAEWVLRSAYRLSRETIAEALTILLGHEMATVLSMDAMEWALKRFTNGGDFADLLHFALSAEAGATSFATFDPALTKATADHKLSVEMLS